MNLTSANPHCPTVHCPGLRVKVHDVYALYEDFAYVMQNWGKECAILEQWCGILGKNQGSYVDLPKISTT